MCAFVKLLSWPLSEEGVLFIAPVLVIFKVRDAYVHMDAVKFQGQCVGRMFVRRKVNSSVLHLNHEDGVLVHFCKL